MKSHPVSNIVPTRAEQQGGKQPSTVSKTRALHARISLSGRVATVCSLPHCRPKPFLSSRQPPFRKRNTLSSNRSLRRLEGRREHLTLQNRPFPRRQRVKLTTPQTALRAFHACPREAPGLSAGGLQVARRQVTLKPPLARITPQRKRPPPPDGGLDHFSGAAATRRPSGRPARCGP